MGHPRGRGYLPHDGPLKPRSRNSSTAAFRMRVLVSFELLFAVACA